MMPKSLPSFLLYSSNADREGHAGRERHSRKRCATDNDKELQETLPSPLACSRFVCKFVSAPHFSPPQVIQPAVRSVISFPFPGFNNPSLISVVHCLITPFDTYKMIVHQLASEVIIPLFQIRQLEVQVACFHSKLYNFSHYFCRAPLGVGICSVPKCWGTN